MIFRKLDQWLLTHHPLLWNMRAHIFFPAILLVHLLFYAAGYIHISSLHTLSEYSYGLESMVYTMASLLAVLTIVLWLVFYLRHNALKSFYPLRSGTLFAGLLLQILLLLGSISFALSWKRGIHDHILHRAEHTKLVQEADTVNLAMHFLPFNKADFDIINSCDSQIINHRGYIYADEQDDSIMRPHSYLYYCHNDLNFRGLKNDYEISAIAQRWLRGQRRDSVQHVISAYLRLCDKYGAKYHFDARQHTAAVFAIPDFRVQDYINGQDDYRSRDSVFVDAHVVTASLQRMYNATEGFLSVDDLMPFLYLAVCAALVLTSFRITRLRTWFIAVVGSGIWAMIFGLVAVAANEQEVVMTVYLALVAAFLIYAAWHIRRRGNKLFSGMALLWFTWALPSVVPVLCQLVLHYYYQSMGVYDGIMPTGGWYDVMSWIADHKDIMLLLGLLVTIAVTGLVVLPLARKWQAVPEE